MQATRPLVSVLILAAAHAQEDTKKPCTGDDRAACVGLAPQTYGQAVEVRLVLAYNETIWLNNMHTNSGFENAIGTFHHMGHENKTCLAQEDVDNCPQFWNCNSHGMCRSGLYCSSGTTCEQCAQCPQSSPVGHYDPLCGTCKTVFQPAADEYSVFTVDDKCGGVPQTDCQGVRGCCWDGSSCTPGPRWDGTASQCTAGTSQHSLFYPDQAMFLEMGSDSEGGHGIVRSPLVVFSHGSTEVTSMYAKLGLINGYPRKIEWEQTALLNKKCPNKVSVHRSRHNILPSLGARCFSPDQEEEGCLRSAPAGQLRWPATECGFATFLGARNSDRQFMGMSWEGVDTSQSGSVAQALKKYSDCDQNMCGIDSGIDSGNVLNIFVTWSGTDADERPMSSMSLSYASFRAFAADDAMAALADSASDLQDAANSCVKQHNNC